MTSVSYKHLDVYKRQLKACIEGQAETGGFHGTVEAKGSLSKAVKDSLSWAGEEDVILAFGSLSYLGELSNVLKENKMCIRDSIGGIGTDGKHRSGQGGACPLI